MAIRERMHRTMRQREREW